MDPKMKAAAVARLRYKKYGITADEYMDMYQAQDGRCAICGNPETAFDRRGQGRRSLCVDHDHDTGKVRSLLCTRCNAAIGLLGDDPARAKAAFDYLTKHGRA